MSQRLVTWNASIAHVITFFATVICRDLHYIHFDSIMNKNIIFSGLCLPFLIQQKWTRPTNQRSRYLRNLARKEQISLLGVNKCYSNIFNIKNIHTCSIDKIPIFSLMLEDLSPTDIDAASCGALRSWVTRRTPSSRIFPKTSCHLPRTYRLS